VLIDRVGDRLRRIRHGIQSFAAASDGREEIEQHEFALALRPCERRVEIVDPVDRTHA